MVGAEAATLLETSVASVNSALQRARATLAGLRGESLDPIGTPEHAALLARYVDAFERLTGTTFVPGTYPVAPRINAALAGLDID